MVIDVVIVNLGLEVGDYILVGRFGIDILKELVCIF